MKIVSPESQYEKFSDLRKDEVMKIVEWIHRQPHLPDIEEIEAILFLYSCYNSLELAKKTLDTYFTMRTLCPEFFTRRDVTSSELERTMKVCGIAPLPYTTAKGEKIIISKLINPDPNEFSFPDVIKLYFMCFDLWMLEEGTADGHILTIDMSGCVLGHILRLSPFLMKKFLYYLQEACPVRIKGLHFINTVPVMDKLLAIMKPFMKKELITVMHLHQTVDTYYEFVPKEYLPEDFGGPKGSMKFHYESFYGKLKENREYFENDEKNRRVDEKQRPGKPKNVSDLFGAEGNFKKLDID